MFYIQLMSIAVKYKQKDKMAALLYWSVTSICFIQSILALIFIVALILRVKRNKKDVCIVVLGDIGRSPRMQYHAKSLVLEGFNVTLVGYSGSAPIKFLKDSDNVSLYYLVQWKKPKWLPGLINYIIKAIFTAIQLFLVLFSKCSIPSFYLVQNPPSIPSLFIVWLLTCVNGATMITDWHNYGYTILSMNMKRESHPLVKFSKWYERLFGYFSHENICVTEAMKLDLKTKWHIKANVLYDKPPEQFKEIQEHERVALFGNLFNSGSFDEFQNHGMWESLCLLTNDSKDNPDIPAIIISSTSWTEDEDFSVLLEALETYEKEKSHNENLPAIVCIITGKGPLKEFYKKKIKELEFKNILIATPWLEASDYPKVIGAGDLGISLHYSSSGLDLPMKVVDMFGCCLPVCAIDFSCLGELVVHNVNGLTFSDAKELSMQLLDMLEGFPKKSQKLQEMRNHLRNNFAKNRWHENWKKVMLPLLKN